MNSLGSVLVREEGVDTQEVRRAARRSVSWLGALQRPQGYWWMELEANTTLTSEYVFLRRMFGLRDEVRDEKCRNELLAEQLPDGGWGIGDGKGAEISTTVEAFVALRLLGMSEAAPALVEARKAILRLGGLARVRVFTRIYFALMGLWPHEALPAMPVWLNCLPPRFPLSIYRMSSWARSCVVPLSVILDRKSVYPVEANEGELTLDSLWAEGGPNLALPVAGGAWSRFFGAVDKVLRGAARRNWVPLRKRALRVAERYVLSRQDDEGDWGGIYPAKAFSMLALRALGYPEEDPSSVRGWEAIERFALESPKRYRMQSCVSPVWDTALVVRSLSEAGEGAGEAVRVASHWLLGKQVLNYGDWEVLGSRAAPGGWSFEHNNRYFPDCDDTAACILALRATHLGEAGERRKLAALRRALNWVISMQCTDGGWGAFDKDNDQRLWNAIPFADHGAMLDNSSPDVTGRVLEVLADTQGADCQASVARAIGYLRRTQRKDGSWYGRWGVNFVYGTWAVLSGLTKAGLAARDASVSAGVNFLRSAQNDDGGWGEACTSYDEDRFVASASTASQTAWGVLGLLVTVGVADPAARRGVQWLVRHQSVDGSWQEEAFTGTGFPQHFYIRYHAYRNCFPLLALAAAAQQLEVSHER